MQQDKESLFYTKLASPEANNESYRASLAQDPECPLVVLSTIIKMDIAVDVVSAALSNDSITDELIKIAYERFPELADETAVYKRRRQKEINLRLKNIRELESKQSSISNDRDEIIKQHIIKTDKLKTEIDGLKEFYPHDSDLKFINPTIEWKDTEKYRVVFVMAPSWGIFFPPYNLAKLTGMLRENGYSVKVYDANIESYYHLLKQHNIDYWDTTKFFLWTDKSNFEKFLLPDLQELFNKILLEVVSANPKVVGFSCYNTNSHATEYFIRELRNLLPDVCIVVGGPEITIDIKIAQGLVNYYFVGEAEENLLAVLDNLPDDPKDYPMNQSIGNTKSKLSLDKYAYPDYTDYDLSKYLHTDGVSIETSRGCIAQCSFCAETYFWRFRTLQPLRIVDEMKYQIEKHGINRFWFVDSLVNGNLKNFEGLVNQILENKLKISWISYARCDGRMTKDFLQKVKDSGCDLLSYGVESGSQKVLYDMRKKIDIWEVENNLRDSYDVGIHTHVNWIWGFPTEEPIDCLHGLQLLFNMRNSISSISPGYGANPATNSHMETDYELYGIQGEGKGGWWTTSFLGEWYTKDFKNNILSRFLRIKLNHIWLYILQTSGKGSIGNSQNFGNLETVYSIEIPGDRKCDSVPYDYKVNFNQFDDTLSGILASEYLPFVYATHRCFGAFKFTFICDPDSDHKIFGDYLTRGYKSEFKFAINDSGEYTLSLVHSLDHTYTNESIKQKVIVELAINDRSFSDTIYKSGNINSWVTDTNQVGETIHIQYRNKTGIKHG